jgi:hypothetical protein
MVSERSACHEVASWREALYNPPTVPAQTRMAKDWLLLACVNLTVPIVVAWKRHSGDASAAVAVVSGLVSLAVLNTVFTALIRARDRRQGRASRHGLAVATVGLAIFSALVTSVFAFSTSAQNDYLQLALSSTPLGEIHPKQKALVVELIRRRAENSRAYERTIAEIKPISPPLYSADSFANQNVIRLVSTEYSKDSDIDFSYGAQQQQVMNEFRDKMTKVDPTYLKSFEAARQEQEASEAEAGKLQRECVAATLSLYDYAAIHSKDITFKNGQLVFSAESVRLQFSEQLDNSKALYTKWQSVLQGLVKRQQQLRSASGVSDR